MTCMSAGVSPAGGVLGHLRQAASFQLLHSLGHRSTGVGVHLDPSRSQTPDGASLNPPNDHCIRVRAGQRSDRAALAMYVVLKPAFGLHPTWRKQQGLGIRAPHDRRIIMHICS